MNDPTDPAAQALLDRLAEGAVDQATLGDADFVSTYRRALDGFVAFQPDFAPDVDIEELRIGDGLRARSWRPSGVIGEKSAALLWCHGGGFIGGGLDAYVRPLSHLAARSGWMIVAPDYRLAPEHAHPAALDDCEEAAVWLADRDEVDASAMVVGGDSCGGLIATWVAAGSDFSGLIALYPNADLRPNAVYDSRRQYDGNVVKLAELNRGLTLYLGGANPAWNDVSPALAEEMSGLPPTLLVTCAHDPLRDEGEAMGRAMQAGGTEIEHSRLPAMIHGILQFSAAIPAGEALIERVAAWLRAIRDPRGR